MPDVAIDITKTKIRLLLDKHFDKGGWYNNDYTDEKIATEVGVSVAVVSALRSFAFGDLIVQPTETSAETLSIVAAYDPEDAAACRRYLALLIDTDQCVCGMLISPTMAKVMLERNTGNRRMKFKHIAALTQEIIDGHWWLTGEPIIFAKEGMLNNGQHRLTAIHRANRPVRSDVRFGISRDAFPVDDIGIKRTPADVLGIDGEADANNLSASLRLVAHFDAKKYSFDGMKKSPREIQYLLKQYPTMRESVKTGRAHYRKCGLLSPAHFSFLHYIFNRVSPEQTEVFLGRLSSGIGLTSEHSGVAMLRNSCTKDKAAKGRLRHADILALCIKAWNAEREGREIRALSWRSEGPKAEPFPMPI